MVIYKDLFLFFEAGYMGEISSVKSSKTSLISQLAPATNSRLDAAPIALPTTYCSIHCSSERQPSAVLKL